MTANLSKTQIDRLGDRLKKGSHTESDLRLLDDYRRSFGDAYNDVVRIIREQGQFPTGRPAKSTVSIAEKLRRESIRLSQMQDIAGCRVVVTDVMEQERVVASLGAAFPGASVIDRRDNPSYGYRAIHIIAGISGKPIEIQVRSSLQHLWAEVSEKSSDVLDPTIKYGGGTDSWRDFLNKCSESVGDYEMFEKLYSEIVTSRAVVDAKKEIAERLPLSDHDAQKLEDLTRKIVQIDREFEYLRNQKVRMKNVITGLLNIAISQVDKPKREEE